MSRPIVVTACMPASSDPGPPHRRPPPWHLRAGGGAVHSIKTRPPGTLGRRKRGWETSADLLLSLSRRQPCFLASNQGLVPGVVAQGGQVTIVLQIVDDNTGGNLVGTGFQQLQRSVEFIHQRKVASQVVVSKGIVGFDDERARNPVLRSFVVAQVN